MIDERKRRVITALSQSGVNSNVINFILNKEEYLAKIDIILDREGCISTEQMSNVLKEGKSDDLKLTNEGNIWCKSHYKKPTEKKASTFRGYTFYGSTRNR